LGQLYDSADLVRKPLAAGILLRYLAQVNANALDMVDSFNQCIALFLDPLLSHLLPSCDGNTRPFRCEDTNYIEETNVQVTNENGIKSPLASTVLKHSIGLA